MLSRFKYFVVRTFSEKGRYQLLWALAIVVTIIAICMIVAKVAFPEYSLVESFWQSISFMFTPVPFRELVVHHGSGKIALAIIYLLGLIAFSGTLIATFSTLLRTIGEKYKNGQFAFALRNHYAILGSSMVTDIVLQIRKLHPQEDIVILTTGNIPELRKQVSLLVAPHDMRKIFFVQGRRDSFSDLRKINIWKANEVYISDEQNETMSDAVSIDSMNAIAQITKETSRTDKLTCHVSFKTQSTNRAFFFADVDKTIKEQIEFIPFVMSELIAQQVLATNRYGDVEFLPLDRGGIDKDSDSFVHFVVIGMTEIGFAMAKVAALTAHYPNYKKRRTRITFVDSQAKKKMYELMASSYMLNVSTYLYSEIVGDNFVTQESHVPEGNFMDIEWHFIQADIEHPTMRKIFEQWSDEGDALLTVAVCFDESDKNVAVGMVLPRKMFEKNIPIWLYTRHSGKLVDIARSSNIYDNLRPFGMEHGGLCFEQDKYMKAAKMINYVYWNGRTPNDYPEAELEAKWNLASVSDRWSSYYNALHIKTKLRSLGIKDSKINTEGALDILLQNLVLLGEVEHNRWCTEKLLLGFRPLNEEEKRMVDYNFEAKKTYKKDLFAHYDIRGLKELPDDVQFYDILLLRNILRIADEAHLFKE